MRTFGTRLCWVCEKQVSTNGFGWVAHNRKHVREGLLKEILDYDGKLSFRKIPKQKSKRGEQRMEAKSVTKVTLDLDLDEAMWLKATLQNPLHDMHPDDESEEERYMREKFFTTLKSALIV